MWWPAIGGLVIGLGGLIFPQALGVGYDTIGALLQGDVPRNMLAGILLVKSVIWAISLGSGTSGGVLAPLLMMGGALGGLEAMFLPSEGAGFWPLVSMGAILGGTMRSPFTGVIFALELTHDVNMLLPLLLAVTIAHALYGADAAAVDPHGEGRAARIPSEPRVCGGSARDPVRARSDAHEHCGPARESHGRKWRFRSSRTTAPRAVALPGGRKGAAPRGSDHAPQLQGMREDGDAQLRPFRSWRTRIPWWRMPTNRCAWWFIGWPTRD